MEEQEFQTATREELLAFIVQQQAIIAKLEARIHELEANLGGGSSAGMPGHKPAAPKREGPKRPRKRRAHGFARRRAPAVTRRELHALAACPDCGCALVGGSVKRTREVIELAPTPVEVVEHQYLERVCPLCGKRAVPRAELGRAVLGRQRLGMGLVSLIATLREAGRLPVATIQWYLATVHGVHLSVGAIVSALARVAAAGQGQLAAIRAAIRASPWVHADETGWRENGQNGYVWTFSTDRERSFVYGGRNKEMVDEVLGDPVQQEGFRGVLVSDFYGAYHHYPGPHQRCWAHLWREIHELTRLYPDDASLAAWTEAVHTVYAAAKAAATTAQAAAHTPGARRRNPIGLRAARMRAKRTFEDRLQVVCAPYLADPTAVQRRLCKRIARFAGELFAFVGRPGVPSENNAAERSLRHLVVSRKISGGTRSPIGTDTKMALSSLFGTWRAQGRNPWLACQQLLASPQV
jgi:transposase